MLMQVQKMTIVNEKIKPKDWTFLIKSCSPDRLRALNITGKSVIFLDARYLSQPTCRF